MLRLMFLQCTTMTLLSIVTAPLTANPTSKPTMNPTFVPTISPTSEPTASPTMIGTMNPTFLPTTSPTFEPTSNPTSEPTMNPTFVPTTSFEPTTNPTFMPTISFEPTTSPSVGPTFQPTKNPNIGCVPTQKRVYDYWPACGQTAHSTPCGKGCNRVTYIPNRCYQYVSVCTPAPTQYPTALPTSTPLPTIVPSRIPTTTPFPSPMPTELPTLLPTPLPSGLPTRAPTPVPSPVPSPAPTSSPSPMPTELPTLLPTPLPTGLPTRAPTPVPSPVPSPVPTSSPSPMPTELPTSLPTPLPSGLPTRAPTPVPSPVPSPAPTSSPSPMPTELPTSLPTPLPTDLPTRAPTPVPSPVPSPAPTSSPSPMPTELPTSLPTPLPTGLPTRAPTPVPSPVPSPVPTSSPSPMPTELPTSLPTPLPTGLPTRAPTPVPTPVPSPVPTSSPSPMPTELPTSLPTPLPTGLPTRAPTPGPSPVPSPVPTSSPSPMPTELPTSLPTPLPTAAPTVGLGVLALDEATVEAVVAATVVAATVASVGAAISGSIGGSIGGSVGGSVGSGAGGGGGASGNPMIGGSVGGSVGGSGAAGGAGGGGATAGNPMMLVFLVQGIFMTSRLSDVPVAYAGVARGFELFNLEAAGMFWCTPRQQMAPPSWAKGFVIGSGRRLESSSFWHFEKYFQDDAEASKLMRSHLFYLGTVISVALCLHKLIYMVFQVKNMVVPSALRAPAVEIQVFLALFMGIIDVSAQVLTDGGTAPGWKMIASIELCFVGLFFFFLAMKGAKFLKLVHWEPKANVRRLRLADTWKLLDRNNDDHITLDELVSAAPKLGLTKLQATELFHRLDANESGTIDQDEFYSGFKGELVAAELTNPIERTWAYFVEPRRPGGAYTVIDPNKNSIDEPWIAVFTSFTPTHCHFLAFRIVVMVVEAFVLGGMHGWAQGVFLSILSFLVMAAILLSPNAVLLAQCRADSIDAVGRFLTYSIYSMIFPKLISVGEAAQVMTVVNGLMLIHSIFTQLEPIIKVVLYSLASLGVSLGLMQASTPSPLIEKATNENDQTSLKELTTPEEAVALVWARLKAHVKNEQTFPASFYKALKEGGKESCKEHGLEEVKEGGGASFDESLFGESLLPLGLKDMTAPVAKILLMQATTATGKMMTVKELLELINEPKYSADGRQSRLERASRSSLSVSAHIESKPSPSLSRSVSIDTEVSEVLDHPAHLQSKSSRGVSRSVSIDTEMSEVLDRPAHLKSKSSRGLSRSVSIDTEMSGVLDRPVHFKSKLSRGIARSGSSDTEMPEVLVHLTSKPDRALSPQKELEIELV